MASPDVPSSESTQLAEAAKPVRPRRSTRSDVNYCEISPGKHIVKRKQLLQSPLPAKAHRDDDYSISKNATLPEESTLAEDSITEISQSTRNQTPYNNKVFVDITSFLNDNPEDLFDDDASFESFDTNYNVGDIQHPKKGKKTRLQLYTFIPTMTN
jgi:hypothetical protein